MAKAFVATFKRDYVYVSRLSSAALVIAQLPTWFVDYNESHPRKALGMRSPREYRRVAMTGRGSRQSLPRLLSARWAKATTAVKGDLSQRAQRADP